MERAVLAGVELKGKSAALSLDDSLAELAELAASAGAYAVGAVRQRLDGPSPTYLGRGKLAELGELVHRKIADVVILDDELSPSQQRTVEEAVGVKVIDRTALIIDIFARRARTREGRLQVELAQHEYLLPRLAGQWSHLERLGGGIGTRGPGESQIETDRRLIRRRIQRLKEQLEEVRSRRALYRERRKSQGIPVVSLVGYTNAGKSTLFNALGKADAYVEDQPFATLDPITRRCRTPSGLVYLLTDTVGFIHKLPPALVAAFRATLEELDDASLLIHVVDIAHPNAAEQAQVVVETLREMGLDRKRAILALNKTDRLHTGASRDGDVEGRLVELAAQTGLPAEPPVLVSAVKGWGLGRLVSMIESSITRLAEPVG